MANPILTRRTLGIAAAAIVVVALALSAALVRGAAAQVGGALRHEAQSFGDPAGDSNGAPDITAVDVASDGGTITIAVTASGWTDFFLNAPQSGSHVLLVQMDTDRNSATGSSGADYSLFAQSDNSGIGWAVMRWSGSDWQSAPKTVDRNFVLSSNTAVFTVGSADLGGTTVFDFVVTAAILDGSDNVTAADRVPDGGTLAYGVAAGPQPTTTTTTTTGSTDTTPAGKTTAAPPLRPLIGVPTTTPKKAVAGKRFTVVFPVTRSDDGRPLTSGRMICDPSVQGKVIGHAESFRGGKAQLSFVVPRTAKGKQLKVTMTIKLGDKAATRIAVFRVL
jgi:hypothetical protein